VFQGIKNEKNWFPLNIALSIFSLSNFCGNTFKREFFIERLVHKYGEKKHTDYALNL
jgi:hypothetical protein